MIDSDIAVVMGTRPEMIKLAPVIAQLGDRARLIHTAQHFDHELSGQVQQHLGLRPPDVVLEGIGGSSRSAQISSGLGALAEEFARDRPRVVIVQGDTNSVSAAAQAANYSGIPIIHVEAGLRSFDREMPEEINRLVAGVLADVHCAATPHNVSNLADEGVDTDRIALTGNTIVEATEASLRLADNLHEPFVGVPSFAGHSDPFVLATLHRPENTDSPGALERVLRGLARVDRPVVLVTHPRTRASIARFGFDALARGLHVVESVPHHVFLALARASELIISDSGGVQEECTVLKKRLLVVRRSTERPESITAGFAHLIAPGESIDVVANLWLSSPMDARLLSAPSPYGDGLASHRIARIATLVAGGALPARAADAALAAFRQPSIRHTS